MHDIIEGFFNLEGLGDVVVQPCKTVVVSEMGNIFLPSCDAIVDGDDAMSVFEDAITEVRTKEARATGQ